MRRLVLILTFCLVISGFWLAWKPPKPGFSLPLIFHLWAGFFFILVFPVYAWEHIKERRAFLRYFTIASSGMLQCMAGGVLIMTGVLLFLYEDNQLDWVQSLHFHWTWGLLVIFIYHVIAVRLKKHK